MRRVHRRGILRGLPVAAVLLLSACQKAMLYPAGPVAAAERTIMIDSLAIMLAIVVPTILAIFGFAYWFRASNKRAIHLPDWVFSGRIELIVWSVPLLTITLLGGVTWLGSHQLDPAVPLKSDQPALQVQVVSLDWKWLFIYPGEHIASVNRLVIPAGVPVHFLLTSASVMNTFMVPQLGSMIYTMAGMISQLNLMADAAGTYHGLSGHFSGDGFSDMHFDVVAMSPGEFNAWVASTRDSGRTLADDSYAALAMQSQRVPPMTFGRVDPGLFGKIVGLAVPPGPGPQHGVTGVFYKAEK